MASKTATIRITTKSSISEKARVPATADPPLTAEVCPSSFLLAGRTLGSKARAVASHAHHATPIKPLRINVETISPSTPLLARESAPKHPQDGVPPSEYSMRYAADRTVTRTTDANAASRRRSPSTNIAPNTISTTGMRGVAIAASHKGTLFHCRRSIKKAKRSTPLRKPAARSTIDDAAAEKKMIRRTAPTYHLLDSATGAAQDTTDFTDTCTGEACPVPWAGKRRWRWWRW